MPHLDTELVVYDAVKVAGPCSCGDVVIPELSNSYMDMASKLFTFTYLPVVGGRELTSSSKLTPNPCFRRFQDQSRAPPSLLSRHNRM